MIQHGTLPAPGLRSAPEFSALPAPRPRWALPLPLFPGVAAAPFLPGLPSLPRPLRRTLSPLPAPRRNPTLKRPTYESFSAPICRAHVAIHDHTRRSKQKYFATAAFSRRRKNGLSGTENDPETVDVSRDVDGWQGHALCVACVVVVEGDLRSSQRSLEPPSSMRTRPPASRCAL